MASYTAGSREKGRAPVEIGSRKDNWIFEPLMFVLVFGTFVVYTTWRMFENNFICYPWPADSSAFETVSRAVEAATYTSPFYSPYIPIHMTVLWFTISPAMYILIFPLAFRLTCYYYRKAYYRAFFADPMACAVGEPMPNARMKYTGERAFPFVLQNLHRFAFYAALILMLFLGWDTIKAFIFRDENGGGHFGIGVGTVVFVINWVLLACYTFGCHSWRHLIGGGVDCYSCTALTRTRYGMWQKSSFLNARHAMFAWCSMISVMLTDVYVNLVSRGIITDLHFHF